MKEEPKVNVLCIKCGNLYDVFFREPSFYKREAEFNASIPFIFKAGFLTEIESVPFF